MLLTCVVAGLVGAVGALVFLLGRLRARVARLERDWRL